MHHHEVNLQQQDCDDNPVTCTIFSQAFLVASARGHVHQFMPCIKFI